MVGTINLIGESGHPLATLRMEPQDDAPRHRHDYLELVLVTGGRGRHLLRGSAFELRRGDVFVIPVDTIHGYDRTDGLCLVNVVFDPRRLGLPERQLAQVPGYLALFTLEPRLRDQHAFASHLRADDEILDRLLDDVAAIEEELRARRAGYELASAAALQRLLIACARAFAAQHDPRGRALLRLGELIGFLDRHYAAALRVEDLARVARVSRRSLERLFADCFGCGPMDYVIRLRIDEARRLLRQSEDGVADIARRVGIDDANYFSRLFQQRCGCTPSAWRRG